MQTYLKSYKELHENYLIVQQRSQSNLNSIFNAFIELKLLNVKKQEVKPLITSLHLIIFSWLSYQLSMSLNSTVTEKIVYQGVLQMLAVIKPYTTILGAEQLTVLSRTMK